jgi:AcrR family transcriptional regulator
MWKVAYANERISIPDLSKAPTNQSRVEAMHGSVTLASSVSSTLTGDGTAPAENSKNRGRHRSEKSKRAILSAVLDLARETPLRDITIEAIAQRAGVGKATIYKWWPSKAYVALDAFVGNLSRQVPIPDTGSAERDFKEQLYALSKFYVSPAGRILAQFIAEGQSDSEFASLFRERFLKPRRELVGVILDRAIKRGEIARSLDRELILDLIYGPAIYRLLTKRAPLNRQAADAIISTLFRGLSNKSASSGSTKRG